MRFKYSSDSRTTRRSKDCSVTKHKSKKIELSTAPRSRSGFSWIDIIVTLAKVVLAGLEGLLGSGRRQNVTSTGARYV
jgi:hypothetical protein